jgi:hypothetical protein
MKLITGMFGWHSNKQIFKSDVCQLSGKKFTDFSNTISTFY